MKTFWLLMVIFNFTSIFTNLMAYEVDGREHHLLFAIAAVCLTAYSATRMDERHG